MEKEKKHHSTNHLLERIFRITKRNNEIDLTGSVAIVNGEVSETLFETEVYQVTFTTGRANRKKHYSIFMSPSESISKKEIDLLKQNLGIEISGDGSLFKIENFKDDFKIAFDLKNSISIDRLGIKKGVIVFQKNQTTRKTVEVPFRKKKKRKPLNKPL